MNKNHKNRFRFIMVLSILILFICSTVNASPLDKITVFISKVTSANDISVFVKEDTDLYPGCIMKKDVSMVNNNSFKTVLEGISLSDFKVSRKNGENLSFDNPTSQEFMKYAKVQVLKDNKVILDTNFQNLKDSKELFSDTDKITFEKDEEKAISILVSLDQMAGNNTQNLICTFETNMHFTSATVPSLYPKTGESTPWKLYIVGLTLVGLGILAMIKRKGRNRLREISF
ncbi:LPXTG cell wall anchor domain-containing protein [Clostridium sp. DL1XJH146]